MSFSALVYKTSQRGFDPHDGSLPNIGKTFLDDSDPSPRSSLVSFSLPSSRNTQTSPAIAKERFTLSEGEHRILNVFKEILNLPEEVATVPEALLQKLEDAKARESLPSTASQASGAERSRSSEDAKAKETPLNMATQISDPNPTCIKLLNTAKFYQKQGNTHIVKDLLDKACSAAESLSTPYVKCIKFIEISQLYQKIGEIQKAKQSIEIALNHALNIENIELKAALSTKIKELFKTLPEAPTKALHSASKDSFSPENLREILAAIREIPDSRFKYSKILGLIQTFQEQGCTDIVKVLLKEALSAAETMENLYVKCLKLLEISDLYRKLGEFTEARKLTTLTLLCDMEEGKSKDLVLAQTTACLQKITENEKSIFNSKIVKQ